MLNIFLSRTVMFLVVSCQGKVCVVSAVPWTFFLCVVLFHTIRCSTYTPLICLPGLYTDFTTFYCTLFSKILTYFSPLIKPAHLVARLRMNGAVPIRPSYGCMACTDTLPLYTLPYLVKF
jgi:hypothetical protein